MTPRDEAGIKDWILGIGLAIQLLLVLFFLCKNVREEPDERFYVNLTRAAGLMFALVLAGLIILAAALAYWGSVTLHLGLIFIVMAALVSIFSIVYFIFERRG